LRNRRSRSSRGRLGQSKVESCSRRAATSSTLSGSSSGSASAFEKGERVFHQKFGYGRITGIEGDKLSIAFEKAGEKKVVASYVTPAENQGGSEDIPF